jgi:hypothetical protein
MQLLDSRVYVLQEFSALKEFVISTKDRHPWFQPRWDLTDLLPRKSAATLMSFSYNGTLTEKDEGKFDPLKYFINLKHLSLPSISWQFCRYLSRCPFHLETFKAHTSDDDFELHRRPLAELWASDTFRKLKHLTLDVRFGTPKASIYGAVIQGMTHLSNLETLDLAMPLKWEWCPQFTAFGKLKKLTWSTERKNLLVNGRRPLVEKGDWKHNFKQHFRTYLPASCHLDLSITVTYFYKSDSEWYDRAEEYSAFTDSDAEAESARDLERPMMNDFWMTPSSSASKRKQYGRNYSSNNFEQKRKCLEEPESSSGFESCDNSATYLTLRRKRLQRKQEKTESQVLGINDFYSGDESDSEEDQLVGRGEWGRGRGRGRGTGRGRGHGRGLGTGGGR